MKDAYGGILNLVFISLFLLITIGVLGLVTTYTKTFKMKNIVISAIEQYEGNCCDQSSLSRIGGSCANPSACVSKINKEAGRLGYHPANLNCPDGYSDNELYCLIKIDEGDKYYYNIIVQADVHFPIVSNILGLRMFQVSGDTRYINR